MESVPELPIDCIEKEECSLCFEDLDSPGGVCVCLSCLQCFCAFRRHAQLHTKKTKHNLYVNLQRLALKDEETETQPSSSGASGSAELEQSTENGPTPQVVRTVDGYTISGAEALGVAIPPVRLEGIYDITNNCWVARPLESAPAEVATVQQWEQARGARAYAARDIDRWIMLAQKVFSAATMSHREQVQSWELQLQPCEHTLMVSRLEETHLDVPLTRSSAKCAVCDLRENLWLCLSCGHLGCGRTHFDGTGGNNHAWEHYKGCAGLNADHAVAVKLGTITADGTADVHCYACDELRIDPDLERHLGAFGIDIHREEKTEKSLIEMEIEQNIQLSMHDFGSISGEENASLQRVMDPSSLGPELLTTGMRNMGNTCYLSSVLQCIYVLAFAQYRWYQEPHPLPSPYMNESLDRHYLGCSAPTALQCFECQMRKLADGLLSQRYWKRESGSQRIDQLETLASASASSHGRVTTPKPVHEKQTQLDASLEVGDVSSGATGLRTSACDARRKQPKSGGRYIPPEGIAPRMLQNLVGQGHPEFATKRQQDAHEFFEYLLSRCTAEARENRTHDPARFFVFPLVQRLECQQCHRVLLTRAGATSLYIPIAAPAGSGHYVTRSKTEVARQARERVSLAECLDLSVASELVPFQCPACGGASTSAGSRLAERKESPSRCPPYLVMHMRRFEAGDDWVPRKVTTAVALTDPERGLEQNSNGEIVLDMSTWLVLGETEWDCLPAERQMPKSELSSSLRTPTADAPERSDPSLQLLLDMGFTVQQARVALQTNDYDGPRAIEWLLDGSNAAAAASMTAFTGSSETNGNADTCFALASATNTRYTLAAAMVHIGASVHTGHYVAYLYRNRRWLLYNDEKVFDAGSSPSALEQAYVLIWRRQDEDLDVTCRNLMTTDRQLLESDVPVNRVQTTSISQSAASSNQRCDGTVLNRNRRVGSPAEAATSSATLYEAEQAQLMSMGFTADASRQALESCGGDIEAALNMLLSA